MSWFSEFATKKKYPNTKKYRGCVGSVKRDAASGVYYGRVTQGILEGDLVTYESPTRRGIQTEFQQSVDYYLGIKGAATKASSNEAVVFCCEPCRLKRQLPQGTEGVKRIRTCDFCQSKLPCHKLCSAPLEVANPRR
jgi:hypothetical protein